MSINIELHGYAIHFSKTNSEHNKELCVAMSSRMKDKCLFMKQYGIEIL